MARRRYLSTNLSIDGRLNRAAMDHSDLVALLYTWMVPHAGDDGMLRGDPDEILAQVFPLRRDLDGAQIRAALEVLADERYQLITWDPVARVVAFPAETFYKYQTYIKDGNRRGARDTSAAAIGGDVRESAAIPGEMRESAALSGVPRDSAALCADNGANQRKSAQNAASVSPSFPVPVSPPVSPSPSPPVTGGVAIEAPEPPPSPPKRAGARYPLPSADELVTQLEEWAVLRGYESVLRDEVERFRDHCLTKIDPETGWPPGSKKPVWVDYAAGCRKWITDPKFSHPGRAPARASPTGAAEVVAAQPPRTRRNIGVIERFVERGNGG